MRIKQKKNIQKKNDETILKRGLIKAKLLIQPKYDETEGKMIEGYQILVIFGDYEYYFGPYKSKDFANDLKNIILSKLDQASNKWGNCKKLNKEQQDCLCNCFKEIEITIDKFFINNENKNNDTNNLNNIIFKNKNEINNKEINNLNNNNEVNIEEKKNNDNIVKNEIKNLNTILKNNDNVDEELKDNSYNLNNISKNEGNKNQNKPDNINEKELLENSITKNNINKNILKLNKERTSPLTPSIINTQIINDKSPEKNIKKELNILHYLKEEDYDNENQINNNN